MSHVKTNSVGISSKSSRFFGNRKNRTLFMLKIRKFDRRRISNTLPNNVGHRTESFHDAFELFGSWFGSWRTRTMLADRSS
ncbi:hypothetical protein QE152_g10 [Popillia japonica]|uniref:Uncharacterized protein n=1 Tax=Popillia japonica TaxID=7064 RepID=A0AAW1NKX0_POPJA